MGEMTPESERRGDGSGWVLAIVLIGLVALLGAGGTIWGYTVARRAREIAVVSRAEAAAMQSRAAEATARAETEARRAEEEAERARTMEAQALSESAKADALREFVNSAIAGADPAVGQPEPGVREALDQAAARLDTGEVTDPNIAASLHSALGMTFQSMGELERAEKHLRRAVELRKLAKGADSDEVARDTANLDNLLKSREKE